MIPETTEMNNEITFINWISLKITKKQLTTVTISQKEINKTFKILFLIFFEKVMGSIFTFWQLPASNTGQLTKEILLLLSFCGDISFSILSESFFKTLLTSSSL